MIIFYRITIQEQKTKSKRKMFHTRWECVGEGQNE